MRKFIYIILFLLTTVSINAKDIKNKINFDYEIGGYVNVRVAYQFAGIVDDLDMVTYDIPVPGDYATNSKLNFDCSTSLVYFRSSINTKALGKLTAYIETNFRGDNYSLSLRQCYISFKNLLIGQTFTNFCDLEASPITVDFQGPNSFNANFNLMIKYQCELSERWSMAASIEMPQISMDETVYFKEIPQTIPDLTFWAQYSWNKSYIRASGVVRTLRYYNLENDKYKSTAGWGAQLSGKIYLTKKCLTYYQGVFGQGITPYIQDITGSGLDLVVDPLDGTRLQMLPMFGAYLSFQYNFSEKMFCSLGYSMVKVCSRNDYSENYPDTYKFAQYFFANMFYNILPQLQVGVEYLMGSRENMDSEHNSANRLQAMVQYNF